jgi:hypothetical protein
MGDLVERQLAGAERTDWIGGDRYDDAGFTTADDERMGDEPAVRRASNAKSKDRR